MQFQARSELVKYSPVKIATDEKTELQNLMKECFEVLSRTAAELYGFANTKKLREEYRRNGGDFLKDYPEAIDVIDRMKDCEQKIISGYIGIANKICSSFMKAKENRCLSSFADLLQESSIAIYEAMYQYNGKSKFSTYVTWCIRNHLIDCTRKNQKINGFSAEVLKLRSAVWETIKTHSVSTEQAINQVIENTDDGSISPEVLERLRASLSVEVVTPKLDINQSTKAIHHTSKTTEAMRFALEITPLSVMERDLIEAHLRGDDGYRRKLSEEVINPNTGKLWTKQRLSQIFLAACDKICATYERQKRASHEAA